MAEKDVAGVVGTVGTVGSAFGGVTGEDDEFEGVIISSGLPVEEGGGAFVGDAISPVGLGTFHDGSTFRTIPISLLPQKLDR